MSDRPQITVYIASHNYGRFLGEAIESVLRQTVDDWELLVINDNSSDNTAEVMVLYQNDERIRLFHTDGLGLPGVCNLALENATGEYLIRLDGDDVFDENILLVLGNWLDRNPDFAMVFSDHYYITENGDVFAQERREKVYDRNHMLDVASNGACCLIRAAVLREIGGYREDLGAQDGVDLWSKLLGRHKYGNVNVPLFYYRRHGSNLTQKSTRILAARQRIKRDAVRNLKDQIGPITAVIPCRANYDFVPNVWNIQIKGRSLLEWNLDACLQCDFLDRIVVASDNPETAAVLKKHSDSRLSFHVRTREETLRSSPLAATLRKIAGEFDPGLAGTTLVSYVQAPFVSNESREEAISTIILNRADTSIGVEPVADRLFQRSSHGLTAINPPRGIVSDFDVVYREANTALATRNRNLDRGMLAGPTVVHFEVEHNECFFIDRTQKLEIARIMAVEPA